MPDFLTSLFDTSGFPPRWTCGLWSPGHGWLHILSDLGIWAAYTAIPVVLLAFAARKRDIPFRHLFGLFAGFILLCGTTHLIEAAIFWWPAYRLAGAVKLATAIVSWVTVLTLVRVTPEFLAMRSPDDLRREIAARQQAEAILRKSEELNRVVVESAVDAIVTADAGGVVVGWNRGAERILGRPASDAVGRPFAEVVTAEFPLSPVAFSLPAEVTCRRADGAAFPAELTLTPWKVESGSFYTVVLRDVSERKRIQDEFRKVEYRLRLALEVGRIGTWEVQVSPERSHLDPRAQQLLGLAPGEFDGRRETSRTHIHPDDRDRVAGEVSAALAGGPPFEAEYRVVLPGGGERWIASRGELSPPSGVTPRRLAGILYDVTDRRRKEEAERATTVAVIRRQRALLALSMADSTDLDAELTRIARTGVDELGVGRVGVWLPLSGQDTLTCRAWAGAAPSLFGSIDRVDLTQHPIFARALAGDRVLALPDIRTDPRVADLVEDELIPAEVTAVMITPIRLRGTTLGLLTFIGTGEPREWTPDEQDFAASLADLAAAAAQADDKRRADGAIFVRDRAIEAIPTGVIITDPTLPDNPIVYANRGFEQITGYPAAEVLGRNCRFLQGKDSDPAAVAEIRAAIDGQRPCSVELVNYRKDGTPFLNALRLAPVADEQGKVTHFVASMRDLTDQRLLERQLAHAQKLETVGRLAGGVAHDFNNLLGIINGYAEMLLDGRPASDDAAGPLAEILDAGRRAAGLTRQLLAVGRRQILQPQPVDLNALIADLVRLLTRMTGEDVRLVTALDPTIGPIEADPGQVEQLVTNLALNARDAMPRGGRLTIQTAEVEWDAGYAATHPGTRPGRHVRLSVTDTGTGMAAATRARIFEPFFTTKELGRGTGLGLAIVDGIARQSGGHVTVDSEVGRGTTFNVYFPAAAPRPAPPPTEPARPPAGGRETVLLVEDEPKLRTMTADLLRAAGYTLIEAGGADEADQLYTAHPGPVHLLMTDVVMPGKNGRELAETLTARDSDLRVLYMSGYTDDAVVRHGVLTADVAFVQKPFTKNELLAAVRQILDSQPGVPIGSGAG